MQKARVACLVECRHEQKTGYDQHASYSNCNPPFLSNTDVFNVLWEMKKQGLSDYTINFTRKALNLLDKHVDLNNPEQVKEFIAFYDANDSYKRNLCYSYEHYLKTYGLTWIRPKYRSAQKMPKIPTEEKLNMIISASRPRLALKLLISKETGMRPIEVTHLGVRDVDLETGNLYPSTAKHGSGRRLN